MIGVIDTSDKVKKIRKRLKKLMTEKDMLEYEIDTKEMELYSVERDKD